MRTSIKEIGRNKSGRIWQIDLELTMRADGRSERHRRRIHGKREVAEAALSDLIATVHAGGVIDRGSMTVGRLLDAWLGGHVASLEAQTVGGYQRIVRLHLRPYFETMPVGALRQSTLDDYHTAKRQSLAEATILHHDRALIACLRWAALQGYCSPQVASRLRAVRVARRERQIPAAEKIVALLGKTQGSAVYVPALVAATCGLRLGEICALRWPDIDEAKERLLVRESLYADSGVVQRKGTKTERQRYVPIPPRTLEALRAHRLEQTERRVFRGERWQENDLVCPRLDGRPYTPGGLSALWGREAAKHGHTGLHFHDLRHVFVSMLIATGADPASIAAMAGHSTPNTTLGIYAHAFEAVMKRSAEHIERAFAEAEEAVKKQIPATIRQATSNVVAFKRRDGQKSPANR